MKSEDETEMEGGCLCSAIMTLTIASLDDPNLVKPTRHIYTDSQVQWLTIDDDCTRFPEEPVKSDVK